MKQKYLLLLSFIVFVTFFTLSFTTSPSSPTITAPPPGSDSFIVQGNNAQEVSRLVHQYKGIVTSQLDIVDGVAATLSPKAVAALRAHPAITQMMPNAVVRAVELEKTDSTLIGWPSADYSEVAGANNAWAEGVTGKGVTVAVVDSGVEHTLPGLFRDAENNKRFIGWRDFIDPANELPVDPNGHGSHIAGIIANSRLGEDDNWNGMAPDVALVGVRVLDEQGMGTYESVIQGIQWVVDNKDAYTPTIKVMNLSIVAEPQSPYWADPINQAAMEAWAAGITVVAAAGNGGPDPMTIGVPGNNPYVITVGAFTDNFTPEDWSDDYLTPFSAAGPTLDGFVKPDVIAPGAHIMSTMNSSSHIAKNHEAYQVDGKHFSMAGTSQATAVVSGIAALILSHDDALTPDQVKYRIMHTALLWVDPETGEPAYSVWQQGSGRVNAYDAVFAETEEAANYDMDILLDLEGPNHYEGYSYYDEEEEAFKLQNAPDTWPAGYAVWAGGYAVWAGGYAVWAGGYAVWAGGYAVWAGSAGDWTGGFSTWASGYAVWAGGYAVWAGGYDNWTGNEPWINKYGDPQFVNSFLDGESPDPEDSDVTIDEWEEEIDWSRTRVFLPFLASPMG